MIDACRQLAVSPRKCGQDRCAVLRKTHDEEGAAENVKPVP